LKLFPFIAIFLTFSAVAVAQSPHATGQNILVIPFENRSQAPGLEWIGDSFPELLQERLDLPTIFVLPREDRLRAYDRLGIPLELRPSRATTYRIAEQLDVDYVVLGSYSFDGRIFSATAQLLDMRREHLLPKATESGPLPQLIDVQTALSWDLLHSLYPDFALSRDAYAAQATPVRLDAFENYIKGIIETRSDLQIQHFKESIRLNPEYSAALLQLGKAYYREKQYEAAIASLARVPEQDPCAEEANFYLGVSAHHEKDFARAESAFGFLASRLPLPEVYNNLGVAVDHRDRKAAVEDLDRAVAEDPNDPDYRFNLAIELFRSGDLAGATRELHQTLLLKPNDSEAEALLSAITSGTMQRASVRVPNQRLRTIYDESSFRQLALKIDAAAEQRLAKADPRTHAQYHADRGREFLNLGFFSEAEREFREAISVYDANANAHAGLASVLEARNDEAGARSEADWALRLRQFPDPLLVLARLDLRDNKPEAAADNVERALHLEPGNAAAQALKRAVAAKLAQEAQPLPNR